MSTFESLKDKVVVVTGGTRGIGYAAVKGFLDNKAKVALFGSRQETVDKALESLKAENPDYTVRGYQSEEELIAVLADIKKELGTVDILINNAGVSDAYSIFDYSDSHFLEVMKINVDAVFRLSRLCAPMMKEKGAGVIINTSSMVSRFGQQSGSAYPTSKFAVNGMTQSLARELGTYGIRINAVAPGIIGTDMVKALDQGMINSMASTIPLKRIGQPEDIANAMLFLASDMASYVTGAVLSVDGGFVG